MSDINSRTDDLERSVEAGLDLMQALPRYFSGAEMEAFLTWAGFGPDDAPEDDEPED